MLDLALTQAQSRGRAPAALPETGFHRLAASRTLVICDVGAPPGAQARSGLRPAARGRPLRPCRHAELRDVGRPRPVDRQLRRGAGRRGRMARCAARHRRAFDTGPGRHQFAASWSPRGSAAASEKVEADRQEANGAQWLEATHDGWLRQVRRAPPPAALSVGIRRRSARRGRAGARARGQVPNFAMRFHLHPAVVASLQQDEAGVLLRLPSGVGWRLRGKSARVAIEESIHLAAEPRRSQQVALYRGGRRVQHPMGDQPRDDAGAARRRKV